MDAVPKPGKTPDLEAAIPEDIPNDPPQRDDDLIAEERPIDTSSPVNQPTSPIRIEKFTNPTKPTDKPTALVQTGDAKDDEVVITGIGRTEPAILLLYLDTLPRKNLLPLARENGMPI